MNEKSQVNLTGIPERFPGLTLMFDTIPGWFSKKTQKDFGKTRHYRAPPMPWGIGQKELDPLLRSWSPRVATVRTRAYGYMRGAARALVYLADHVSFMKNLAPAIVTVTTKGLA